VDLTRPVTYRNADLNDATLTGGLIAGCQIDEIEYYAVDAVGYREKRSASDGLDASDVYLGGRTIRMRGTLYGGTRPGLFDRLTVLRTAFLPTAAYAESPGDLGYLPLRFEVPTANVVSWPTGYIPQMIRARGLGSLRWTIIRDHIGGALDKGYAVDWEQFLEARDPRILAQDETIKYFSSSGSFSSGGGTITNRGAYPTPINILIFVPAADGQRKVTLTIGGSSIQITVPNSTQDLTARYNGTEKTLTLEEQGTETLRMDLLAFPAGLQHPLVPASSSSYTWECRDGSNVLTSINAESRFWFWEAWA
jgi:hypothetical protein